MVAVVTIPVVVETICCKVCDKPIARREGSRLIYERRGSNPAYLEFESGDMGGSVLIQCHYAPLDTHGRPNPCRTINRIHL